MNVNLSKKRRSTLPFCLATSQNSKISSQRKAILCKERRFSLPKAMIYKKTPRDMPLAFSDRTVSRGFLLSYAIYVTLPKATCLFCYNIYNTSRNINFLADCSCNLVFDNFFCLCKHVFFGCIYRNHQSSLCFTIDLNCNLYFIVFH